MVVRSIGFIGGGRVTRVIIGGWTKSGTLPHEIVVSDPDESVLSRLKGNYSKVHILPNGNEKAASQDIVFLAVHPPVIADALANVKNAIRPDAILVSLAPKLTISRLSEMLNGFGRIARMIPNAPSIVGAGFNPLAFGQQLPDAERKVLCELLSGLGECPIVTEGKLEVYAITTAMSPTYFWPQLYELYALAESFGLSPAEAREGIWQTVCGALATMFNSGLDRASVEDLIPVKPLGEMEPSIREAYRTKLPAIMEKIRP